MSAAGDRLDPRVVRNGEIATFGGHDVPVEFSGETDGRLWLAVSRSELFEALVPLVFAEGGQGNRAWAKIWSDTAQRLVKRTVRATVSGREVFISSVTEDGLVAVVTYDRAVAQKFDLQGSERDGWRGTIPSERVSDVMISDAELPR